MYSLSCHSKQVCTSLFCRTQIHILVWKWWPNITSWVNRHFKRSREGHASQLFLPNYLVQPILCIWRTQQSLIEILENHYTKETTILNNKQKIKNYVVGLLFTYFFSTIPQMNVAIKNFHLKGTNLNGLNKGIVGDQQSGLFIKSFLMNLWHGLRGKLSYSCISTHALNSGTDYYHLHLRLMQAVSCVWCEINRWRTTGWST